MTFASGGLFINCSGSYFFLLHASRVTYPCYSLPFFPFWISWHHPLHRQFQRIPLGWPLQSWTHSCFSFLTAGSFDDLAGRAILLAVSWRAASRSLFGNRVSLMFCCMVAIKSLGGVDFVKMSSNSFSSVAGVKDSTGVRVSISDLSAWTVSWVGSSVRSSSSEFGGTSMGMPVSREVGVGFFALVSAGSVGRMGW